ncbi:putative tail tape measure protein [Bacteroides phage GEC_vB_Bfr_VA7]|nr:putative tail tape measure protein [Bacteroides phage GEC_vB_Bfr_VA7]
MANEVKGIKYSDLIQPDSSIKDAITQLEGLQKIYDAMLKRIEEGAKGLQKPISEGGGATEEGRKKIDEYEKQVRSLARAEVQLKLALTDTAQEIAVLKKQTADQNYLNKLQAKLVNSMAGSYNALSAQYELNKIKMNNLSQAYLENTEAGKKLVKETAEIYAAMDKYQKSTGKHTLSVGNYKQAFDGLGFSISQVARELPSLAISANTFFLAISNNIPMVIDEIQKLRAANEAAAKAGEAQVSITGKLVKSLFSFNTVMVLILTAFSIWGKDIVDWIGGLITGKKKTDGLTRSIKHMADAMQDARLEAAKETTKLNILYKTATNNAKSTNERTKAVKALKKEYPEYFKNLSDEEIKTGKATTAYNELSKAIVKNAKARAALDKITELQKQFIDEDQKRIGILVKKTQAERELAEAQKNATRETSFLSMLTDKKVNVVNLKATSTVLRLKKAIEGYGEEAEKSKKKQTELTKSMENLTKLVNVDAVTGGKGGSGKEEKEKYDLTKKYEESRIALIIDARVKEENEIREAARKELSELKKKTTEQQRATQMYADTVYNIEAKLRRDLEKMRERWAIDDLQKTHDFLSERLNAVRRGTGEELIIQTQLLENERKQDELRIKQSTDTESRKNERLLLLERAYQLSKAQLTKDFTENQDKRIIERSVLHLSQQQQAETAAFDIVQRSEKEQDRFRLKLEREKWEQILELTRQYGEQITGYNVKTVEDTIKGIDNAIKRDTSGWDSKQGVFGNLFDLVFGDAFSAKDGKSGAERAEQFKESILEASEFAIENLKSVAQARVEAAEVAVQAAEKEVSARQKVLDAEIQARANGYANNVATAQKELDFARKQQEKALRDKKKAQKQQERIDTLMQASSLVTATANLWKDLGLAAIPAIALMWGSFAFAKIKASQLSKASQDTEEYGDGTVEMIDYGGSHASGNDVDLGTTKDGKRRRVERGEYFAVVNKRSSQKYKKLVPDLINSLNKGTFEQKYLNAYSGSDEVTNIMQGSTVDLSKVEKDLKSIKEQGRVKYITGADGTIIEVRGNIKRIIKS